MVSVKVINTQFARMVHMIIMLNNVTVAVKENMIKKQISENLKAE